MHAWIGRASMMVRDHGQPASRFGHGCELGKAPAAFRSLTLYVDLKATLNSKEYKSSLNPHPEIIGDSSTSPWLHFVVPH